MTEYVNALNTSLYNALAGASGLTTLLGGTAVYFDQAPDDAALPYVVFSYAGGAGHDNRDGHETVTELMFVRGYNDAGPALAGSISAQIDTALRGVNLSVTGWSVFYTAREQSFSTVEVDDANVKTWMRGAQYRYRLEKS